MQPANTSSALMKEVARRRTFAIISHPDAGKTTLTEKFLLYGGAVQLAGSVTARKKERATTSDWLELERKRGISVSSTLLQFDYHGYRINLLDTPGHKDFSEDTYRVLTAVDAVIMVIDAGVGIEAQTRKLFEVCRDRGVPLVTFMNKLDRPTRDPMELLDELGKELGISAYPVNWPLGTGTEFKGVWDRRTKLAHLFERTARGASRAPVLSAGLADPQIQERMGESTYRQVCEELEILDMAGVPWDADEIAAGRTTPVYFGSAVNNFGIELLLDGFLEHAPFPTSRANRKGELVPPDHEAFSGFVFKIQANMDPQHRDRVAFTRVVSGKFERDMLVFNARTGRKVRLSNVATLFGADRSTVDEGYPGDVLGIVGNHNFAIGDTLTTDTNIVYDEIPGFAPECFAYLENLIPSEAKRFRSGLEQLLHEGVVQAYELPDTARKIPLLGAAGSLQFEVVQFRLESEYGAQSQWRTAPWTSVRWLGAGQTDDDFVVPTGVQPAHDSHGNRVYLFETAWMLRRVLEKNPELVLVKHPIHLGAKDVAASRR